MNAHLVSIIAQISACNARVAAMQAENLYQSTLSNARLYDESNFYQEADKLEALAKEAASAPSPKQPKVQDMFAGMDKATLDAFARSHFGVSLNKRQRVEAMREQVQALVDRFWTSPETEKKLSADD